MLQNQTCGVVHLKCTLFGAVREGNHGYQLSRPIPTSLSGRYRVQLHRLTSNQEFDFDPLRLRFDLEEERMVREVRIIRRLKDKCVVFCTTSMRGTCHVGKPVAFAPSIASAISRERQELSQ